MTNWDLGALVVAAWFAWLLVLMVTVDSQGRGQRSWLERAFWKKARLQARRRRADLVKRIRDSDLATRPQISTLNHMEREDVLFLASTQAFRVKLIFTLSLTFVTGATMAAWARYDAAPKWQAPLVAAGIFVPFALTGSLIFLTVSVSLQRWTTDIVTATARRSYEALLKPFHPTVTLDDDEPYQSPHIAALRALEDCAHALERYAVQRALTGRGTPMPQVVAHYTAAAVRVRELRDAVELDRQGGRGDALLEIERMLKVLASPRVSDLAPARADIEDFLDNHQQRRVRRRQALTLVIYTLALAAIVTAVSAMASPLGVAVATVAATLVLTSWAKVVGIPFGQEGNSSRGS